MNKNILDTGVQSFILKNIDTDIMSVLLKKSIFEGVSPKELAQQIEVKKKCEKKLPLWFKTLKIYYPKKINIEQTSSEKTAHYKAQIVDGKSLLDVTGGFGIDSYYFGLKMDTVIHCEIDSELAAIASYNFKILEAKNIQNLHEDGMVFLEQSKQHFDWIYVDPSRRNDKKGKVFALADCLPEIPTHLDLFFSRTNNVLLKTAPLLDISAGLRSLNHVKEIHIVAIKNEVKELLWILEKDFKEKIRIKTFNATSSDVEVFDFDLPEEKSALSRFEHPKKYLYEPNAAVLKSGGFRLIGQKFNLSKLSEHTHLYTSSSLIDFPGRCFEIIQTLPYHKKSLKSLQLKNANISIRNFPDSVTTIRKKFKIKDGGNTYLFFFKNKESKYQVLICAKL